MEQLKFSIPEILSLIGIAQCLYVIVYMLFRSGRISRGSLALLYFLVLGLAFLSDFMHNTLPEISENHFYAQWFFWFLGPPLSVLLIIQITQINQAPAFRHYWVLGLLPAAYLISMLVVNKTGECAIYSPPCEDLRDWLTLTGLFAGSISLLTIRLKQSVFPKITAQRVGRDRYWLILALILANIGFLFVMLASLNKNLAFQDIVLLRTVLGLGFVYLLTTSLFRIYPQAVQVMSAANKDEDLSKEEQILAQKIEKLLAMDKVYQESAYSRADLAREIDASEAVVSKIINNHFKKSFPQLINEHRIEDAKQLLRETDAAVKTIASEVGFNSLASFNRVFKELTDLSPSQYRKTRK